MKPVSLRFALYFLSCRRFFSYRLLKDGSGLGYVFLIFQLYLRQELRRGAKGNLFNGPEILCDLLGEKTPAGA